MNLNCQECGKEIEGNPNFCPTCGNKLKENSKDVKENFRKIETEDEKLGNAMNLLGTSDSKQVESNANNPKFDPIDEEDLDWG